MKKPVFYLFLVSLISSLLSFTLYTQSVWADDDSLSTPNPNLAQNQPSSLSTPSALIIHKPAPDPTWGKVIQFRVERTPATNDKPGETLYHFLFQDSNGTIRWATFHENASGNGYWEVLVWDLP